MPVRFDAWSAATCTALWTRPWSNHSGGDRLSDRSLRRSVGGFRGQEEVRRLVATCELARAWTRPVSDAVLEAAGVWLITYDRPGGGCSDPLPRRRIASTSADVAAVAEAWEVDRFCTAGFSGRGSFALATAALLAERL